MHYRSKSGDRARSTGWLATGIAAALLWSATAAAENIDFVAQLDPFPGNDRYGDVWGEGHYAYLGSSSGVGVMIIDISTPSAPFLATTYAPVSSGKFKDIKVEAGIGYFASDNFGGLHIVDLADPPAPVLLAQVTSAHMGYDRIHNIFVRDGYLYEVSLQTATIKVFDVSAPAAPFFVRDIATPDPDLIHDVTVIGSRLFAAGFGGFTYIYDVSQVGTMAPVLLGSVPSGANSHSSWASSDGNLLIVAREIADGDVRIYDVTDPSTPLLLSTIDQTFLGIEAHSPHNPVLFNDGLLFVSWYQAGVVAIDIVDPTDPIRVGNYDTFSGPVSLFEGNWGVYPLLGLDRVLASDLDGGLFVLDATALGPPRLPATGLMARLALAAALLAGAATPFAVRTAPLYRERPHWLAGHDLRWLLTRKCAITDLRSASRNEPAATREGENHDEAHSSAHCWSADGLDLGGRGSELADSRLYHCARERVEGRGCHG